ncbi:MAG: Type IV pilus biogenesis protein PilN [Nitrospira sp.]|jgi:type IV pilus assembly protein PilN|nr:MAG: Type IV pilus biogenesis protein PilN [Nitrospira sp.]
MIKINLLATGPKARKAKPQWDVRAEALLGVGVLAITLTGCWFYASSLDDEIQAKQNEKQSKDKQVAQLKEQVKAVQDFEQKKKQLEDKNRIIDQLEKSRTGPVKVLDHVSQSLNPLKVWLVRMNLKGNNVELEGRAMSNDDVVEFVNNLRRTDQFGTIKLMESRAGQDNKLNTYQFKLDLSMKG